MTWMMFAVSPKTDFIKPFKLAIEFNLCEHSYDCSTITTKTSCFNQSLLIFFLRFIKVLLQGNDFMNRDISLGSSFFNQALDSGDCQKRKEKE